MRIAGEREARRIERSLSGQASFESCSTSEDLSTDLPCESAFCSEVSCGMWGKHALRTCVRAASRRAPEGRNQNTEAAARGAMRLIQQHRAGSGPCRAAYPSRLSGSVIRVVCSGTLWRTVPRKCPAAAAACARRPSRRGSRMSDSDVRLGCATRMRDSVARLGYATRMR